MQNRLYNLATDKYRGVVAPIIKFFLFLLSIIYRLIVKILIMLNRMRAYRLNCKVISIGNITLGGTGKTSLVEFLARYLKQQGHKVAILSRGYKRKVIKSGGHKVTGGESICDEPHMLQMNLKDVPIIVDADRVRSGNRAVNNYGVGTVILDDGFQQWRLIKDLEIVTIDATNPFGNRKLLPRGILREPLSSLKRADIFILTKTNLNTPIDSVKNTLSKLNPQAAIIESTHDPKGFYDINNPDKLFSVESLKGKTVSLFSGIGDPDSFEDLIVSLGLNIGLAYRFCDHHNYTEKDLDKIIRDSRGKGIDIIITTEKDAARLSVLQLTGSSLQLLVFRIELSIKDEQKFYNRLHKLYSC